MANTDSSPASFARGKIVRGIAAVLIIAAITYGARNVLLGEAVQRIEATRADITQTVVASGHIISPQRVVIGVVVTDRVVRIPVTEGQVVRRGEVLIELDTEDERAALALARAGVAQAEARLRQLREVGLPAAEYSLAQTQANAVHARQQFERNKSLHARGFIGQSQLDEAQRSLDVTESQLRAARLQVLSNAPSGSEYAVAQSAFEQALASQRAAQSRLEQMVIRAPVEGVLIARNVEPGNVVQPGK